MSKKILLVGAGHMACEYAKILAHMKQSYQAVCRKEQSAVKFEKMTYQKVIYGGLKNIKNFNINFSSAIVAVNVDQLFKVTKDLINLKIKRILLEKPGALNLKELDKIIELSKIKRVKILIGYNRRFYDSVHFLKKEIKKAGGISSIHFEFTEFSNQIKKLKKSIKEKNKWLIANSSHVIDLAFHLAGKPAKWNYYHNGYLNWHRSAARFSGAGITKNDIPFSYFADWFCPGRWGIEIMTRQKRFILKPIEELKYIRKRKFNIKNKKFTERYDRSFKPGLYQQLKNFLSKDDKLFCTLAEQRLNFKIYYKIAGYQS
jgi:hypothetical protein